MDSARDSFQEEFLQRQRSTTQKVFYPINLSFAFVDSTNSFYANQRLIKPSPAFENILNIKFNSPEDNLKVYKFPVWFSHVMLFTAFVTSSFIPFYFMAASPSSSVTFDFVLCWMFWSSFFISICFALAGWRKMENNRRHRRSANLFNDFRLRAHQLKAVALETLLLFFYYAIVFYVSDHIENIFICYVHTAAIVLRFCFKMGRSITISKRVINGYLFVVFGIVLSLFHFNMLKDNYSLHKGLLSIVAAFLSGAFWLLNREDTLELNLGYKLFLITIGNILLSGVLTLAFFKVSILFSFLVEYFFALLGFVMLLVASFYLKSVLVEVYEDIIPALLYTLEPLCLYLYWEVFVRLGQTYNQGKSVIAEFFSFFIFKFCFVLIFLLGGQLLVQIEMKRNEVTLHGGRLGIKTDQRDRMKYKHMDLLLRLNVDNAYNEA